MATWMTYSLLISAALVAPALALDSACGLGRVARRGVWAAALGAVLLATAFPLRAPAPAALPAPVVAAAPSRAVPSATSVAEPGAAARIRAAVDRAASAPLLAAARADRAGEAAWLAIAWTLSSAALLLLGGATLLRSRRLRRRWPAAIVAGERVRIAPRAGPLVMGIVRPEVVVPTWLLGRDAGEQRMVLLHEREHLRARDPVLLTAGWLAVALVPWNPFAWWMLYRLRAAVEVDCDRRVLRRGVRPLEYGSLLIDVARRSGGLPLGAAALAAPASTLERRILAMVSSPTRLGAARAAALAVVGGATLLAACETRLPTATEVEAMDVAAIESPLLLPALSATTVTYRVDGVEATAEDARALPAERIASIEVKRAPESATVEIRTREAAEGAVRSVPGLGAWDGETPIAVRSTGDDQAVYVIRPGSEGSSVLYLVDGVRADATAIRALRPEDIARIEVVKGSAATQMYGEEGANGVVRITTKGAAPEL